MSESKGICLKCGRFTPSFDAICTSCGHRPSGDGLVIAWLVSSEHLNEEQLKIAAARIKRGEPIRPSAKMLTTAHKALGRHFSTDEALTHAQRLLLLTCSVLLTPLVGWVIGFWWWNERPRAAVQSFALSVPATVLFTVGVLYLS